MGAGLKYWYWLGALSGAGAKQAKKLLGIYGNAYEVFRAPAAELEKHGFLTPKQLERLASPEARQGIEEKLCALSEIGVAAVSPEDAAYPELIKEIEDPPPVLFMRGAAPYKSSDRPVAVVGTRRPTAYGIAVTKKLVSGLAAYGFTIVSGLAAGIDAVAHRTAVEEGAKTIAFLGCGPEKAYPPGNARLMEDVIGCGAVYSEYPPGTLPFQQNFPQRNRLISGMSVGVIVVEASERSGALITAGFAGEQGRDVFAVPGNVTSPQSRGANALLRDGAMLAASAEDVALTLNRYMDYPVQLRLDDAESRRAETARQLGVLNGAERGAVRLLGERGPLDVDAIAALSRTPAGEAGALAVMLEIKGLLRRMADGKYELTFDYMD